MLFAVLMNVFRLNFVPTNIEMPMRIFDPIYSLDVNGNLWLIWLSKMPLFLKLSLTISKDSKSVLVFFH
jgi:hypothetical protein